MKKLLTMLLAGLMLVAGAFSFTACGPAVQLEVIEIDLTDESYAFAVNEGNTALKNSVDAYLAEIKGNGQFQAILDKYLEGNGTKVGYDLGNYDATKDQLVVLTNTPFEPFEYTDAGKYYGIDIEIAAGLAADLGKELCIVEWLDFNTILNQFNTYPNAVVMAGLTADSDRELIVDFSDTYFQTSQRIIMRKGDTTFEGCLTKADIDAKLAELTGKKVGYQNGTQGGYYLEGFDNLIPSGFQTAALAAQALKNGAIDFVIVDEAPANAIVTRSNNLG